MTAGLTIGIDAKGGAQAEAELKRVAKGADAIAAAEHKAAGAAKLRGQAQKDANAHGYRTAHAGGDHGGFMHGLHVAGMAGGEVGHLGHKFGRAGRFGAAGLASAGAGLAASAIMESMEAADERMSEMIKKASEFAAKMHEAKRSLGENGLGAAESNALSLRRIGNAGGTFADIQKWQKAGVGAGGLSALMGAENWQLGAQASAFAGRLGSSPDTIAGMIAKGGGLRAGQDPEALGKYYAELDQNRRIGGSEMDRAREGGGAIGERLEQIERNGNLGKAKAFASIEDGSAGTASAEKLSKQMAPVAAAIGEAWKKATEESEVLHKIADNQSLLLKWWQNMSSTEGSAAVRAIRFDNLSAAVLATGD